MVAWVAYESFIFYAMYLSDAETSFNHSQCDNDGGVRKEKNFLFLRKLHELLANHESFSQKDIEVAHWFIPNNCSSYKGF